MNEAFKEELADMEANERTARELEECYFSDEEDLVVNPAARTRKSSQVDSRAFCRIFHIYFFSYLGYFSSFLSPCLSVAFLRGATAKKKSTFSTVQISSSSPSHISSSRKNNVFIGSSFEIALRRLLISLDESLFSDDDSTE